LKLLSLVGLCEQGDACSERPALYGCVDAWDLQSNIACLSKHSNFEVEYDLGEEETIIESDEWLIAALQSSVFAIVAQVLLFQLRSIAALTARLEIEGLQPSSQSFG
jgi:hypothetical protein